MNILHDLLDSETVLLLGNGINRYKNNDCISWESILQGIAQKYNSNINSVPPGYPLTEYFELLQASSPSSDVEALDMIVSKTRDIEPAQQHFDLLKLCKEKKTNIITTNFDHSLQKAGNYSKSSFRKLDKGFTNYYPWQRFYASSEEDDSIKIWHINGDYEYRSSIKLSLSAYAGCLTYFRYFDPNNNNSSKYRDRSWVNELMEKNLVIAGLQLSEAETFIRGVLIRRFKYIKTKYTGQYVMVKTNIDNENAVTETKKLEFFLNAIGIEIIFVESWDNIYNSFK